MEQVGVLSGGATAVARQVRTNPLFAKEQENVYDVEVERRRCTKSICQDIVFPT